MWFIEYSAKKIPIIPVEEACHTRIFPSVLGNWLSLTACPFHEIAWLWVTSTTNPSYLIVIEVKHVTLNLQEKISHFLVCGDETTYVCPTTIILPLDAQIVGLHQIVFVCAHEVVPFSVERFVVRVANH
jgi:hypothetical protein